MSTSARCANEPCGCHAASGTPYCGQYCASVDCTEPLEGACSCGHEECEDRQEAAQDHSSGGNVKISIGSRGS